MSTSALISQGSKDAEISRGSRGERGRGLVVSWTAGADLGRGECSGAHRKTGDPYARVSRSVVGKRKKGQKERERRKKEGGAGGIALI